MWKHAIKIIIIKKKKKKKKKKEKIRRELKSGEVTGRGGRGGRGEDCW